MILSIIYSNIFLIWLNFKIVRRGGHVFGPYFIRNRPYNSAEYVRLLAEEVFPEIQFALGGRRWRRAIWMQVNLV